MLINVIMNAFPVAEQNDIFISSEETVVAHWVAEFGPSMKEDSL